MADTEVELPELDRLLREELSVEPSPAFLPKVRARIEEEADRPRRSRWLWGLTVWQAAAALVILVVAAWFVTRYGTPDGDLPVGVVAEQTTPPAPAPDRAPSVAAVQPRIPQPPPIHRPQPAVRTRAASAKEPAVLVDARQRVAIREVMALVGAGKLTEESFVPAPPVELGEIEVPPIAAGLVPVSASAASGVQQKGSDRDR